MRVTAAARPIDIAKIGSSALESVLVQNFGAAEEATHFDMMCIFTVEPPSSVLG